MDKTHASRVHHTSYAQEQTEIEENQLVRSIDEQSTDMKQLQKVTIIVFGLLIFLGIGTGYLLAQTNQPQTRENVSKKQNESSAKTVGLEDNRIFKDSALGTLEKGGIDGEGTHKLIRDGGPSQTAYLVSSVIDLDEYVGKKVKVFGQTMTARKAPWLMDVGKITLE